MEMTYDEFLKLESPVNKITEYINGTVFFFDSPGTEHFYIISKLIDIFGSYFRLRECQVFFAPYDIYLNKEVYVPDLLVVCDSSKIKPEGCVGSPDLIIEVLSPTNNNHDLQTKKVAYEKHGIKEYWIINPVTKVVLTHLLSEGYERRIYKYPAIKIIHPYIFPQLCIRLDALFGDIDKREFTQYLIKLTGI